MQLSIRVKEYLYSRYSLDFTSDPYSPWEAYFSLQVRKLITKIAILNHLKVISQGLNLLGTVIFATGYP